MINRFLHPYNDDEYDIIEENLDIVYDELPFSLGYPVEQYENYLEQEDYFYAFRRYLDVFEMSIQYTSSVLITELQRSNVEVDDKIKKIISAIIQKPLSLGDWVNDILIPLLKEANCKLPDLALVKSLSKLLLNKKGNVLQGWSGKKGEEFKGIVYFRNTYFGHDTTLSKDIFRNLLEKVEPMMFQLLEALLPLSEYTAFSVSTTVEEDEQVNIYAVQTLSGVTALSGRPIRITTNKKLDEGSYYLVPDKIRRRDHLKNEMILNISPFVVYLPCNEEYKDERYSYLFQTIQGRNLNRLKYVSSHEKALKKETSLFKNQFVDLINNILANVHIGDNFKINIEQGKSWEEYQERSVNLTQGFLGEMKKEKYDPELFTDREYLASKYCEFINSSYSGFVLLGSAGSGKSNQLCHWTQQEVFQNNLVLSFNCKIFSGISIERYFQNIFDEKSLLSDILKKINDKAQEVNKKVILIFDAINECLQYQPSMKHGDSRQPGPIELLKEIDHYFVRHDMPAFKSVISCRTYTWEELIDLERSAIKHDLYFSGCQDEQDQKPLMIKGLSEEELRLVYPKYQLKYKLLTSEELLFAADHALIRGRLSDPLVLKMACDVFRGRHLPKDARQFYSGALFENLLVEKGVDSIKGDISQYQLLNEVTAYLWNNRKDSLNLKYFYRAYENQESDLYELSRLLFIDDAYNYSDAFNAILEKGILRVEKRRALKEVRFVYERYQEYLFSQYFQEEENEKTDYPDLPISSEAYKENLQEGKNYAVIRNALRTALIQDYLEKNSDPKTIIDLACDQQYDVQQLIMDALAVFLDEDYKSVCELIEQMLKFRKRETETKAKLLQEIELKIEESYKKEDSGIDVSALIKEQKTLEESLIPVIRIRKVAIHTIYELFKSDIYAKQLFDENYHPINYLIEAMSDPIAQVRDTVSLYVYYISKFNSKIGLDILEHFSGKIMDVNMLSLLKNSNRRNLQQTYFEPASRIGMLMVVENLVAHSNYDLASQVVDIWRKILKKYTLNHSLIKIVMPFFKFFLRRQATVQTAYVNNGLEYQHFWTEIPAVGKNGEWSHQCFGDIIPFLKDTDGDFESLNSALIKGMYSGDAFSYFLIERVLIVQGIKDWNRIRRVVKELIDKGEESPWVDYMQMSLLYVMFHILEKSKQPNNEMLDLFSELTYSWTVRCKGLFAAHYNHQANKGEPYKQYVLNWYGAAYCSIYKDGGKRKGDDYPMPEFYQLIEEAFYNRDKELLYYCIENIAVLVSDFGYYQSALELFQYVLSLFKHESTIHEFDKIEINREIYKTDLRTFLCQMLGTIKSYYPREVEYYINNKLINSTFPNIDKFREELLNYNQSHETIGDLLTHKFGNFVIWSLLNDDNITSYFESVMEHGVHVNDYFSWFDKVVRLTFEELFEVKF